MRDFGQLLVALQLTRDDFGCDLFAIRRAAHGLQHHGIHV